MLVEGGTYKGVHNGPCLMAYDGNTKNKRHNFTGCGVMFEGKLHGGPAFFIQGDGWSQSFSNMIDGRPEGVLIRYLDKNYDTKVISTKYYTDRGHCASYIGEVSNAM